jgi:hypothetical protein
MAGTIRIQVYLPFTISEKGEAMIPIPLCIEVITVVATVIAGKKLLED